MFYIVFDGYSYGVDENSIRGSKLFFKDILALNPADQPH
jgi:hypothetical protein